MILRNSLLIMFSVLPLMSLDGKVNYDTQKRAYENIFLKRDIEKLNAEIKNIQDQINYRDSIDYVKSLQCKN